MVFRHPAVRLVYLDNHVSRGGGIDLTEDMETTRANHRLMTKGMHDTLENEV